MTFKLVEVLQRRPDLSPEQFQHHWLEVHGPMVRAVAESFGGAITRYVQSHTVDTDLNATLAAERSSGSRYDGIVEVWFDIPLDDLAAAFGTKEFEEVNRRLIEDERRFIDPQRSSLFLTREHVLYEA